MMGSCYDYETSEENAFCNNLTKWANAEGIEVATVKLNLKGRRGWPDRLVIWEGGCLLFIEFKRPGEEPRKLQGFIHVMLERMGFTVEVHDDRHTALVSVQAKIRATSPTARRNEARRYEERVQAILEAGPGQDSRRTESL